MAKRFDDYAYTELELRLYAAIVKLLDEKDALLEQVERLQEHIIRNGGGLAEREKR